MGVGVSSWRLARAVGRRGMVGVISGTGIDQVLARRLQLGDADGSLRRAMAAFPFPATVERALARFHIPGGKAPDAPFRVHPVFRVDSTPEQMGFASLAAFVEVWLAKEGHDGPVGINLLEKIALPNPALIYGAMLAGVDYVLVGAGIPWQIPGIIDSLSRHEAIAMKVTLEGEFADPPAVLEFDPKSALGVTDLALRRPGFLAIVSSSTLAQALLKRATGSIEGFVVEASTAGGHNAPPRGASVRNERGEPVYGERDKTDPEKMRALGLPFWLAGQQGRPGALARAQELGAHGIQVGTLFAFCAESGLQPDLRRAALARIQNGGADVLTDALASPTGFPFKVVDQPGTLSDPDVYAQRTRVCDMGYLRRITRNAEGKIVYRCPAEPVEDYVAKGGDAADTAGRKCLCNALIANLGLAQVRSSGEREGTLLTAGDDLLEIVDLMSGRLMDYTADDVLDCLLEGSAERSVPAAHV